MKKEETAGQERRSTIEQGQQHALQTTTDYTAGVFSALLGQTPLKLAGQYSHVTNDSARRPASC